MAGQGRCTALLVLVAFVLLADRASGAEYKVGGISNGWKVPPTDSYYTDWLADKKFVTGDVLVFEYAKSAHSVLQVSEQDYTSCNTFMPIKSYTDGETKVTLDTFGDYFFICGISDHCSGKPAGQKIQVTVTDAPSPETSPSTAKPPSSSSSSRLHASGALVCSVLVLFVVPLVV